ncbi:MAG: penicillin-binding protein [Clostridia bacterium]|nr:penicillin-binding protein [Clostridia bacterium]
MKGIARRSKLMLIFTAAFLAGVIVLVSTFVINAQDWAFKRANLHIYSSGQIVSAGKIFDRNGKVLAQTVDGEREYSDSKTVRRATLHAVGDLEGFIATGAHTTFRSELTGYSFFNGVYDLKKNGAGNDITLTIDSDLCTTALNALGNRKGAVGVYNYKTGEILCMVSTPTYDPENKPDDIDSDTSGKYDGIYLNRFLSGVFTPGSTFKVVTAISAIENIADINLRTFKCNGSYQTSTGEVRCNGVHGNINFGQALSKSCNSAFACIAEELGNEKLTQTAEQLGFNQRITVDGVKVTKSFLDLSEAVSVDRGWAGIGQYTTLANPCQMMTVMGAIANGGSAATPKIIKEDNALSSIAVQKLEYMSSDTANTIAKMMRDNVLNQYGEWRFPELEFAGKTGTAEVADGDPHSWFVGFSQREDLPLAVVVVVENGGEGISAAAPIANKVMQAAAK